MQFLFLIPFFISLYFVIRNQPDKAFLNVYLPCLILVPTYYMLRLPHLPPFSPSSCAMIPLGLSLLFRPVVNWKFRRMDLWVLVFMVSIGLSETLKEFNPKNGMLDWIQDFVEMALAYVVGRQVIEPNLRLETIKRIIFLFICLVPLGLYEYRFGVNPLLNLGINFFGGNIGWFVQLRGGHARVAASFGHAILAGMLFLVAMALNYYLVQIYKLDKRRLGPRMSILQKYRIPFLILPVMIYLTGSRMPMACAVLCFLFLQIPRFKKLGTGITVILSIIVIGGGIGYSAFQQYTSGAGQDEAQSSAIYRKQLLENYAPVLEEGGWLGWGAESFPRVQGQVSVDNDYLILQLSQGKFGEYSFLLLAFEAVLTLWICAFRFRSRESVFLVFSLMGAIIGIFVALSTVALMEQVIQVLFLLLGWTQSLQDTSAVGAQAMSAVPEPKFRFRRVIA